jgi:hypothetical protein
MCSLAPTKKQGVGANLWWDYDKFINKSLRWSQSTQRKKERKKLM